jgi:cell wall-associated NlpC family hydrolase
MALTGVGSLEIMHALEKEADMRTLNILILILCILFTDSALAKKKHKRSKTRYAAHQVKAAPPEDISPDELANFDRYPRNVRNLIVNALELSSQHLAYKFGSGDPENRGLDCSGAISYLLKQANVNDVPRQADEIYQWAYTKGDFFAVNSHRLNSFEFSQLKPGDLLFWSGTYPVKRDPSVTHVMMYLGRDKQDRPLMFGATSRRGQSGVGVFAFKMPSPNSKIRFLGYGCIPHLSC